MKIVIAGAGAVGEYLAKMLLKENHDLVIIDKDAELINYVNNNYDLYTVVGSCTSFLIQKEADVHNCDLYIAVTHSQEVNILSCVFAKKIGAKKTIARISNMEYLNPINKLAFINLGVDKLIYPEFIAAKEVVGVLKQTGTTEIFDFSGGKLTLFVIRIDEESPIVNKYIKDISKDNEDKNYRIIAITRNEKTIIPNGDDMVKPDDFIYIITRAESISAMLKIIGKEKLEINNIMILGGSSIGVKTARYLQSQLNIKLIESNVDKATTLADELSKTTIINIDGRDVDALIENGIENADAFVAVTGESETNILSCLIAKRLGVKKTIAEVENIDYIDTASRMGIDTIINKKLSAASNIYTLTMNAEITNIKCLTGTDAEVLEFVASRNAVVCKNKIKDVDFPDGVIVGGIVRGNKSFIAVGDTQIKPDDKVVVFALPKAIHKIASYF